MSLYRMQMLSSQRGVQRWETGKTTRRGEMLVTSFHRGESGIISANSKEKCVKKYILQASFSPKSIGCKILSDLNSLAGKV